MADPAVEIAAEALKRLPWLIETTRALVAVASPNPPSNTAAIAAVAERLLRAIPRAEVRRVEPEPGVVSLIARIPSGKPGPRLIFNGHLDTFPIGENLGWTVPPLGGVLKDGRLYGRGVSDMKAGLACSLLAATLLVERPDLWRGEIVLTLAGDEENMGALGTGHMLAHEPLAKGDAMICGDVGSPAIARFGEKGLYWLTVSAEGSPAHGAHVHRGVNAIDRLREALARIKRLERLPVAAPDKVTESIAAAQRRSEKLSGRGETRTLQRVTVNIGTISGGVSPNLIPSSARAELDIRLPVGVTIAEVDAAVDSALGPLAGISWHVDRRFEPSFTDPTHPIMTHVLDAGERVLGRRPALTMRVGASDARWYRMHGVPTVVYGLTPFGMGGPDEHILVEELASVAQVHALAALAFLKPL